MTSGYVLAYQPLHQAHFDRNRDAALHGLAYSIFRRGLLSAPVRECSQDPFYGRLISIMPPTSYNRGACVRSFGAALTLWSLVQRPGVYCYIVNDLFLRISKISFSFYLVHGPIIRCLFHSAIPHIYRFVGDGTYGGQGAREKVFA